MNAPKPKKNVALSFKVTEDLNKRIEALAVKWDRSKSWTAIKLIEEGLSRQEKRSLRKQV